MTDAAAASRAVRAERLRTATGIVLPNPAAARFSPAPDVIALGGGITVGSAGAGSAISGAVHYPWDHPAIRYLGATMGEVTLGGIVYPNTYATNTWSFAHPISTGFRLDFETDADKFEFATMNPAWYEVWVDGHPTTATANTHATDGFKYKILVDFGSPKPAGRHVELLFGNQTYFGGINVNRAYSLWKSRTPKGPRWSVIGDSWPLGTGIAHFRALGNIAARHLGARDVWQCCIGGTGYVASGSYTNFYGHVPADVLPILPDVGLFIGGTNDDNDDATVAQVPAKAAQMFGWWRANLPRALLIVCGPTDVTGSPSQRTCQVRDSLRTATVAAGGCFVDLFGGAAYGDASVPPKPMITGTGNTTTPAGDGNADVYIGYPGNTSHPSDAGSAYMGSRIASDIAAWFDDGAKPGAVVENGAVRYP